MPRRVALPGASELFRSTTPTPAPATSEPADEAAQSLGTGRVRHDEKITVYVTSAELLALEQARLTLRAQHGLAVDRGRIVRTAVSLIMADLAERGGESELVQALTAQ